MERRFEDSAKIEQDSAGIYLVTFPDFPEAATDGRSRDPALAEAVDCLEEAVAARIRRGDDIPQPSRPAKDAILVTLRFLYAMKAALYLAFREMQISQSALAAKLGKNEEEVRRLLDPAHASRPSALEAALRAIGKRVQLVVEDAG